MKQNLPVIWSNQNKLRGKTYIPKMISKMLGDSQHFFHLNSMCRSTESVVLNKPTTLRGQNNSNGDIGTLSVLLAPKDTVNMNKKKTNDRRRPLPVTTSPKTNTLKLMPYTPANHLMKTSSSSQRPVFLSAKRTPTSKGLLIRPNPQVCPSEHV